MDQSKEAASCCEEWLGPSRVTNCKRFPVGMMERSRRLHGGCVYKVIKQVGTNSFSRRKCTLKEGRPVGYMGALGTLLCESLVLKTQTYSFNKSLFGSLETPIELLFLLREINWPNPLEEGRVEYIIMERWLSGNLVTGLTSFSFSSSYLTKIH